MTRAILLDAGPRGLLTAPPSKRVADCRTWLTTLLTNGARIVIPEIADYEVRRELIRMGKTASIARLDALNAATEYLPLTTAAMRLAAELWAQARQQGQPTAGNKTIDADVILAAQCLTLGAPAVAATTNIGHLARFVPAELWENIST